MKSCSTCPSFLGASEGPEIRKRFKRIPGTDICGRFGHVLSNPKDASVAEQTQAHYASSCSDHGKPMPKEPVTTMVVIGKPSVAMLEEPPPEEDNPDSCGGCTHFVSDSVAYERLGVAAPVCALRGTIITNVRTQAKDCALGKDVSKMTERGEPIPSLESLVEGFEWLDELKPGFRVNEDVALMGYTAHIDLKTDPRLYVTDKPVSDRDKADGLRAWRRVSDPSGFGPDVWYPIFDPNFFSEEERAKIPTHGDESHPEDYLDYGGLFYSFAVEAWELDETPLLQGQPGLGKTEFFRALAYSCGLPFERITFRKNMDAESLLGAPQYDPDKGTYFQPGRLPQAWTKPCVLLLDEPNLADDDDVFHVLRPLTDNSKQLVIEGQSGDGQLGAWRFPRHDFCFMGMAQNPAWDPRNIGTRDLASADANRLSVLTLTDPPEAIVRSIVRRRCKLDGYDVPEAVLTAILAVGEDIRHLEGFPDHWGTRQAIKVARKTKFYDFERAFRSAALDLYEPELAEQVLMLVASHKPD